MWSACPNHLPDQAGGQVLGLGVGTCSGLCGHSWVLHAMGSLRQRGTALGEGGTQPSTCARFRSLWSADT